MGNWLFYNLTLFRDMNDPIAFFIKYDVDCHIEFCDNIFTEFVHGEFTVNIIVSQERFGDLISFRSHRPRHIVVSLNKFPFILISNGPHIEQNLSTWLDHTHHLLNCFHASIVSAQMMNNRNAYCVIKSVVINW
jgi:hypothetical protein